MPEVGMCGGYGPLPMMVRSVAEAEAWRMPGSL